MVVKSVKLLILGDQKKRLNINIVENENKEPCIYYEPTWPPLSATGLMPTPSLPIAVNEKTKYHDRHK